MSTACELINNDISTLLEGRDLLQFKKIDDSLKSFKERKEADSSIKVGCNVTAAVT